MITSDQLKDAKDRVEALHRYLDIDAKTYDGEYDATSDKTVLNFWFAGFYPAEEPRVTVVVMQDDQAEAPVSSAAVFRQVCEALQAEFALSTVLVNENTARTNVILGRQTRTVLGSGFIRDTLAGVALQMGVHEFYQVNTPAAEVLYAKAREYAALRPDDFLLDLYCVTKGVMMPVKPTRNPLSIVTTVVFCTPRMPSTFAQRHTACRLSRYRSMTSLP